jgi:mono/diheme cytochrome c family protein
LSMTARWPSAPVALVTAFFLIATGARAQMAQVDRGRALAQANCARCQALAEGIRVAHPMPEFRLEPNQIDDLIAYLKSLGS